MVSGHRRDARGVPGHARWWALISLVCGAALVLVSPPLCLLCAAVRRRARDVRMRDLVSVRGQVTSR